MTREQIYDLWAPAALPWSLWAKPVLFAHLVPLQMPPLDGFERRWTQPAAQDMAVVVDLPGRLSVVMGLSLAAAGYRPVPLYNAVPGRASVVAGSPSVTVVDVASIGVAIVEASAHLAAMKIPAMAPPAFLLDRDRRKGFPQPGDFDNRSISLPTDFPSAAKLREHGIARVLLIQPNFDPPQADLSHTLRRWQDAGIPISVYSTEAHEGPRLCRIERPSWYKAIWHNLVVSMGLRRNPLGGYGGLLPVPSAG